MRRSAASRFTRACSVPVRVWFFIRAERFQSRSKCIYILYTHILQHESHRTTQAAYDDAVAVLIYKYTPNSIRRACAKSQPGGAHDARMRVWCDSGYVCCSRVRVLRCAGVCGSGFRDCKLC